MGVLDKVSQKKYHPVKWKFNEDWLWKFDPEKWIRRQWIYDERQRIYEEDEEILNYKSQLNANAGTHEPFATWNVDAGRAGPKK